MKTRSQKIVDHVYFLPTVIVGGSTVSFLDALDKEAWLFRNREPQQTKDFIYPIDGKGIADSQVRSAALYVLAGNGKIPIPGYFSSARLEPENDLCKFYTANNRLVRVKYKNLILYDVEGISGLPFEVEYCGNGATVRETYLASVSITEPLSFTEGSVEVMITGKDVLVLHDDPTLDQSTVRLFLMTYYEDVLKRPRVSMRPMSRTLVEHSYPRPQKRGNIEIADNNEELCTKSIISALQRPIPSLGSSQYLERDFSLVCRGMIA